MSRTHYLAELESIRRNVVEMGETFFNRLSASVRA